MGREIWSGWFTGNSVSSRAGRHFARKCRASAVCPFRPNRLNRRRAPNTKQSPPPRRGVLIGAAALSGFVIPWELGFGDPASFYNTSAVAALDGILVMLFCADIGARLGLLGVHLRGSSPAAALAACAARPELGAVAGYRHINPLDTQSTASPPPSHTHTTHTNKTPARSRVALRGRRPGRSPRGLGRRRPPRRSQRRPLRPLRARPQLAAAAGRGQRRPFRPDHVHWISHGRQGRAGRGGGDGGAAQAAAPGAALPRAVVLQVGGWWRSVAIERVSDRFVVIMVPKPIQPRPLRYLEYDLNMSLLGVTVARNLVVSPRFGFRPLLGHPAS
jgi:hypothetical protein